MYIAFKFFCHHCLSSSWQVLFPASSEEAQSSLDNFSPQLVYWLLQHLCNLPRPSNRVWRWKPAKTDESEIADVTRIRDLRNFVINAQIFALFEDEYDRKVAELYEVM